MGTVATNFLPANPGQNLGSSAQPWNAFLQAVSVSGLLSGENVNSVLCANLFTGADIGAQINAAYAALPSTGGIVFVQPGAYTITTPIYIGTLGKPCFLMGCPGATTITVGSSVQATITAVKLGWGLNNTTPLSTQVGGLYGLRFVGGFGSAGTSIGLEMNDGVNGVKGALICMCEFQGFNVNVDYANVATAVGSFWCSFDQCEFQAGQTANINYAGSTGTTEANHYQNCIISNGAGYGVLFTAGASCDLSFDNCHFDYNTSSSIYITSGAYVKCSINEPHFEASTASSTSTTFIDCEATGGTISIVGGVFIDAGGSGTKTQMVLMNAGSFSIFGSFVTSGACTYTEFINVQSTAVCTIAGVIIQQNVSNSVNTTAGGVTSLQQPVTSANQAGFWWMLAAARLCALYEDAASVLHLLNNSKGLTIDSSGNVIVTNGNLTASTGTIGTSAGNIVATNANDVVTVGALSGGAGISFVATASQTGQIYQDTGSSLHLVTNAKGFVVDSAAGNLTLTNGAVLVAGATPTAAAGQVGLGTTAGFGNGTPATAVTTTTKGTGTGPTTAATVVNYLQINIAGTAYYIPLMQ